MPITNQGFQRKTYDDILTEQTNRARLLFGDDIDTSENSTFGKLLRLYCLDAAENQELAENVYLSAFPNSSSGVSLDRLCPFVGISRNAATYAQHTVEITGSAGTTVEMGFLVAAGDIIFHTVNGYTIGSNGKVSVTVECNDAGTIGNVSVGDITEIVNPAINITAISHTAIAKIANDIETDYELRTRFSQALSGTGSGTLDSIRGAVLRVTNVESVYIVENATASLVNGIPPHSFITYVHAPVSAKQSIAEAIFSKKPIGIRAAGDEDVTVTDIGGGEHEISFSWTEEVSVYVRCTITTGSGYSSDSLQAIKDNIVRKISGYTNGQNVTSTSLYSAIYVDGVTDVTALTIGTDGSTYSSSTISISYDEVAVTSASNIEVTVNGQ